MGGWKTIKTETEESKAKEEARGKQGKKKDRE